MVEVAINDKKTMVEVKIKDKNSLGIRPSIHYVDHFSKTKPSMDGHIANDHDCTSGLTTSLLPQWGDR